MFVFIYLLVVAEQYWHRAKDCSSPGVALPAISLGVHQVLGGAELRQLTQAGQRDVPCHVVPSSAIKWGLGRVVQGGGTAQGLSGHQSAIAYTCLEYSFIITIITVIIFPFLFCPIKLSLSQPMSFYTPPSLFFFFISLPHAAVAGWGVRIAGGVSAQL